MKKKWGHYCRKNLDKTEAESGRIGSRNLNEENTEFT